MRVMQVKRVSPNELYTKRGLEREMNISVRSINKYVIDDNIENKSIRVSNYKVYKGSDINEKIDELILTEKFVLQK